MHDYPMQHEEDKAYSVVVSRNLDDCLDVAKALASELRLTILKMLRRRSMTVMEIAEALRLPQSTAAVNIKKLEDAGLIFTELVPGTRGTQKLCAATVNRIVIDTNPPPEEMQNGEQYVVVSMPIGHFFDFDVKPTCGMANEFRYIGELDDPRSFLEPERVTAQLLWFHQGYVEYRFPNRVPFGAQLVNLELTMELCSEAPYHNPNWPSDITLWVNGVEVGTWTCPGDFGGKRGILTPEWFSIQNTQFGVLKNWRITEQGCFIDGRKVSERTLSDFHLDDGKDIVVRIGIKEDAVNVGGVNLFGRKFGNYETDIVLRIDFKPRRNHVHKSPENPVLK
ncbi:transcriptional regulator [Alicyclobacillus cellulosilyticus]|uniref:Transcriptional regulator n=1 Tax=Alicyclobacillus cellulosilyticus TaxID=1003997 RepID=A0A917KE48_9BACL|nr:helix-turn-helix domain-containing protein [Alicyclobacillus cellulosilyticus]GGJ08429.1 transcriptional regulator [Alicyclobacillus cellulosilyticus]